MKKIVASAIATLVFFQPVFSATWTIGSGTAANTSTGYPAPYGNYYWGAKHQFIYAATQLTAAGMTSGAIDSLGFFVTALNGCVPHQGYTVSLKNSATASLTAWETGMTVVINPATRMPALGWNLYKLDTPFSWDGTSNLILEVCFSNTGYITNASTQMTTGLPSGTTIYLAQDNPSVCVSPLSSALTARPNLRIFRNCGLATPTAITGPGTVCAGASAAYSISSVSGAATYTWACPAGATINSGQGTTSISVTFGSASGTITVTANNSCGASSPAAISITVNPLPNANAGNDTTICLGDSAALTASGGTGYSWSTGETGASIMVSPASNAAYTVTVTNNGCSASDAVLITVNPLPAAYAGIDTAICLGDSATLSASGGINYSWSTGETTAAIAVAPAITTVYAVIVSDAGGCSGTDEVTVTVDSCVTGIPAPPAGGSSAAMSDQDILIIPNPTDGMFNVKWIMDNGKLSTDNYQLLIINVFGECIYKSLILNPKSLISNPESLIDISSHPAGIYFVKVTQAYTGIENKYSFHKIIKQ